MIHLFEVLLTDVGSYEKVVMCAIAGVTLVALVKVVFGGLHWLLYGDPPTVLRPACVHDKNRFKTCLKAGGCRTVEECDSTVKKYNA